MKKIIRVATIPLSLDKLLEGQLKYLNKYFKVVAVSSKGELLDNVEKREGVKVFPIEIKRAISPLKDLVSLWKLYRYFRKEKPMIVHSITPKAGLLSMCASYFARVPIRIHTFTGLIFPTKEGGLQKLLIFMDKLLCRFATNIYPEGQGVMNDLQSYKITNKSLRIIANGNVNGIDSSHFNTSHFSELHSIALKRELNIEENDFIFIFVGRLVRDKGINELVSAFENLSREEKQIKLLLVGPFEDELDPLKEDTKKIINKNNQIISVGFQKDVRPYFSISNVLVFPSYREGFPNVVMQAGAMELPSIVTDINGCNEIILNGENGWIIPVKSEDAILDAMKNCILDKYECDKVKINTRRMILERFEQQTVWEALLKEYKSLEKNV